MNNTQLYLAIGLPTLTSLCTLTTVIIGWFLSRADINRLNDKIDALSASLRAEMTALRVDINRDMVAFRKEVHGDLLLLHERVVRVEAKQGV